MYSRRHARAVRLLYLEYDGMVYLVQRGGRWSFPVDDDVPFAFDLLHDCRVPGHDVAFGIPRIADFPADWMSKDEAAWRDDVDPVVRRAINGSLTREVVGALIRDPRSAERILMVRAARGFTKGTWNMPGGFVLYGEAPEDAVRREVREEVGMEIRDPVLVGIYTRRFSGAYFMRAFVYGCATDQTNFEVDKTEIETADWMALAEARERTLNPFTKSGIEALQSGTAYRLGKP
jgi:ADP-ribose pyrophosphatase YjhB (NUDIX family)